MQVFGSQGALPIGTGAAARSVRRGGEIARRALSPVLPVPCLSGSRHLQIGGQFRGDFRHRVVAPCSEFLVSASDGKQAKHHDNRGKCGDCER